MQASVIVIRIAFFAITPPSSVYHENRAHDGTSTHGHTLTKGVLYRLSYVDQFLTVDLRRAVGPNFTSILRRVNYLLNA